MRSPGILFEKISKANAIEKFWHIVYYYNLHTLEENLNDLKAYTADLNNLCTGSRITCKITTETLNRNLESILSEKVLLQIGNREEASKQSKRNTFFTPESASDPMSKTIVKIKTQKYKRNVVKNFLSDAFLEEDLSKHLEDLEQKIIHTKIVSQQQLTLINQTATMFNHSFETVQARLSTLDKQLASISGNTTDPTSDQETFDALATYTMHTMKILNRILEFVKAALTNNSISHLLQIIPLHKIAESVHAIQPYLSPHQKIPIKSIDDINLLKLISHENIIIDNNLAISVKIPINNSETKTLYKLTPIPIKTENYFFIIQLSTQYAMMDSKPTSLIPITTGERNRCISINDTLICPSSHPTYYENYCEFIAYFEADNPQKYCLTHKIPSKNYITPLYETNSFFLTIDEPFNMTTICPNSPNKTEQILQDGKITLKDKCKITSRNFDIKMTDKDIFTREITANPQQKPHEKLKDNLDNLGDEYEYIDSRQSSNSFQDEINKQLQNTEYDTTTEKIQKRQLKSKLKTSAIITVILIIIIAFYLLKKYSILTYILYYLRARFL